MSQRNARIQRNQICPQNEDKNDKPVKREGLIQRHLTRITGHPTS